MLSTSNHMLYKVSKITYELFSWAGGNVEAQDTLCIFGSNILRRNHAGKWLGKLAIGCVSGGAGSKKGAFSPDSFQHSQSAAICPFVYTGEVMSHATFLLAVRNNLALYWRSEPHTCVCHTEVKNNQPWKETGVIILLKIIMYVN